MAETQALYEPGSPDDPERFNRGYYESGRERHDLIKSVHTLSDFCQRYKQERDEARMRTSLIRAIADWQAEQFPNGGTEGVFRHMKLELSEIDDAMNGVDLDHLASEFAGMVFLGIQGITRCGLDPETVIRDVLEINRARQWGEPDDDGVVEHVRDHD